MLQELGKPYKGSIFMFNKMLVESIPFLAALRGEQARTTSSASPTLLGTNAQLRLSHPRATLPTHRT